MKIGGHTRYFNFTAKGSPYTYGYLYVSKPDEVAALKKHPYFGSIITIVNDDTPAPAEKSKKYEAVYPEVTKSQEAIAILAEKHGVTDAAGLKTKAAIKDAAEKLNISFPNL